MKDPLTNEEFKPKRSNQRFSCNQNRIKYHNYKANQLRKENAHVDKPLKRNKKTLDELMQGKPEGCFHEEFLRGAKYDFNFYTSICKVKNGTGYCLYNYILIFEKPYVHVIRNIRS